jgi:hypothetical protein
MKLKLAFLILVSSSAWAEAPEWVNHSGRQVIGGDIVHWGTGDAATPDVAVFKARHMAIKTLIEECGGVASKEIIPRKQYVDLVGRVYRAAATVSIEFSACDAAKGRNGKRFENPEIASEQKLYNRLVFGETDDQAKALQEVERRIKEDQFERASENESQIQRLKNDVASLRADMEARQEAARAPAAQHSQKEMCQAQLTTLMSRITMHAAAYHGNMADPRLGNELGQAYQLKKMCAGMQ